MNLTGKTAIVTGGSSGIGKAIAMKFVVEGAKVHVLDVNSMADEGPDNVTTPGSIKVHSCDVSDFRDVQQRIDEICRDGNVDILVNNAGVSHIGTIESTNDDDLDRLININIKGVVNCSKACIPSMKEAGGGVILNIASIGASVGLADRFAYSMTKGAVLAMTYSIAKDYIKHNIRCVSISPARVHTPFVDGFLAKNYPGKEDEMFEKLKNSQPIGRMGSPEEIADLAAFLCSDKAGFITGTDYPIDGGFLRLNT